MKKLLNYTIIVTMMLILFACKKDGLIDRSSEATSTRIMFVHAVPVALQFNFFVNDTKLTGAVENTNGLQQGMGYNTANQPAYFGYCNVLNGPSKIKAVVPQNFEVAANDVITAGTTILEKDHEIEQGKSYTMFAYGTAKSVLELFLTDELISAGQGGIRFVNLMPGTVSVDLEMTYTAPGSTTPVVSMFATNIAYGAFTPFKAMPVGTYVFQRKRTRTNTLVGSATTITRLNAGQNFTLCARGTAAAMLQIPYQ